MKLFIITYHVKQALGVLGRTRQAAVLGANVRAANCRLELELRGEQLHIVRTVEQITGVVQL